MAQIKERIESTGQNTMEANSIEHALRSDPHVKACCSLPMGKIDSVFPRMTMNLIFIDLSRSWTELLLTINEIGDREWVDCKEKNVLCSIRPDW
jgi:hypothetical protein